MDREELESKYHELRSCRAAGEYYGVSEETIRRRLKEYGIPRTGWKQPEPKPKRKYITEEDKRQIVDAYQRNGNIYDTAKELGHSPTTVWKYVQLAGHGRGKGGNQTKRKITDEQLIEACKTMTRQEIADKYGMHVERVQKRMHDLGIHAKADTERLQHANTWHYSEACNELIERTQPDFEFVSYRRKRCKLRCKCCGNIVERAMSTIRQKHIRCEICHPHKPHVEHKLVTRECVVCGAKFRCYENTSQKTCSIECRKMLRNTRTGLKRVPEAQIVDPDITLRRLFKRDNGICYICGGRCDFSDWRLSGNGKRYPGEKHPSIDHVIPIARGGLHSWDNVRLAHWGCNIRKGAGLIDIAALPHDFAVTGKHFYSKKRTAQYSLDGQLIKVWESAAAIEKELGLSSKHIQNVCRKDKTKTGNAYGYHWEYV